MKRLCALTFSSIVLTSLLTGLTYADEVKVNANKIVRLQAKMGSDADLVFWTIDKEEQCDAEELPGGKLYFTAPPGTYRVKGVVVPVKDGKISGTQITTRYVVTIGGGTPPNPPNPPPDPGPGPGPSPDPPPIPDMGFRVIVLEETADRTKLPEAQQAAIFSVEARQYMDSKTVTSPRGAASSHEWGIFDKDSDLSGYSPQLNALKQKALADPEFKTPWIIMGDGKTGYSGPLPGNKADFMRLLKKYAEGGK